MRMHGSWHIYRPGERWQRPRSAMRIVIETTPFVTVGFDIPDAEFVSTGGRAAQRDRETALTLAAVQPALGAPAGGSRRLPVRSTRSPGSGPICWRRSSTPRRRASGCARGAISRSPRRCSSSARAGIGNVFKSEILFEGGVHPRTPVSRLSDDQLTALIAIAHQQLAMNVRATPGPHGGARGPRGAWRRAKACGSTAAGGCRAVAAGRGSRRRSRASARVRRGGVRAASRNRRRSSPYSERGARPSGRCASSTL